MNPKVFDHEKFKFFFFSREETRKHVHIYCPEGQAKFWLEPVVALATYYSLSKKDLRYLQKIVEERYEEIIEAWEKHFGY